MCSPIHLTCAARPGSAAEKGQALIGRIGHCYFVDDAATASDLVSPGCYFTTIGGVTLEPGYSWLTGVIIPSTTTVKVVELGSSGTKDAPVSIFGRTSSLSGVCTFKRNPPPS